MIIAITCVGETVTSTRHNYTTTIWLKISVERVEPNIFQIKTPIRKAGAAYLQ